MALTLGVLPSSSTSFDSIIFWICSPMLQKRMSMPTTLIPKGGGREGKGREGGMVGKGREGGRESGVYYWLTMATITCEPKLSAERQSRPL